MRAEKPNLDLVLTHVDDRFDNTMHDAIGADAARAETPGPLRVYVYRGRPRFSLAPGTPTLYGNSRALSSAYPTSRTSGCRYQHCGSVADRLPNETTSGSGIGSTGSHRLRVIPASHLLLREVHFFL